MFDDKDPAEGAPKALAGCIRAIGTPAFYRRLLEVAEAVCGFEHLSVFAFSESLVPVIEVLEGLEDPSITDNSARTYLGFGYHGSDPAQAKMKQLASGGNIPAVFVLRAKDIADPAYRSDIYEKNGLDGRISLIGRTGSAWRSVNFYKHIDRGAISYEDVDALASWAEVLFAAETRHVEIMQERKPSAAARSAVPTLNFLESLLTDFAPSLSPREAEVCARALQGATGEGTALSMNVSEATVATLRRRAYAKLGISNLNELFAMCLSAAAQSAAPE